MAAPPHPPLRDRRAAGDEKIEASVATPVDSRDAIAGAILGCAVGDAVGLPYEGLSRRRGVRLLGTPDRHRFVFGHGMVSDDTEHSCMVAQALCASPTDADEFARLTTEPFEHLYPDAPTRQALAERVVAAHSFDARAAALLETAYRLVDSRR